MMKHITIIFAVVSMLLPVSAQKTGFSKKNGLLMKMLCAAFYLVTGVLASIAVGTVTAYPMLILVALLFGFLGDFFLSWKHEKYFLAGVLFFALGHLVYSIAFLGADAFKAITYIIPVTVISLLMTLILLVFAKVKLNLGNRQNPLLLYAAILFFFFVCAVTKGIIALQAGNYPFGIVLVAGGVLFIVSDILLGLGMGGVRIPHALRHTVSYTYFPAQTLFALSIIFQ